MTSPHTLALPTSMSRLTRGNMELSMLGFGRVGAASLLNTARVERFSSHGEKETVAAIESRV